MNPENKESEIITVLEAQNALFNPARCSGRDKDFQYTFQEKEGTFQFYLSVRNKKSSVVKGISPKPDCEITTDLKTLNEIFGGYLSPLEAVGTKRFQYKSRNPLVGNPIKRYYGGNTHWELPSHLYKGESTITGIRKVLVLNCSPRGKRGATSIMVEAFAKGMQEAGAEVEILYPGQMRINPCTGCFQCWVNSSIYCIYHDVDDMKIILEKYWSCDLIVWATPIYHYHGTTIMKTLMDRLFINADPHFIEVDGEYRHPRKVPDIPCYAVLAVGGFPDKNIFKPLQSNFKTLSSHTGIRLIGEIYRHTSMPFVVEEQKLRRKDEVLKAIEKAGRELIVLRKIPRRTKRCAEQDLMPVPILASMINLKMDRMQAEKKNPFLRKLQ